MMKKLKNKQILKPYRYWSSIVMLKCNWQQGEGTGVSGLTLNMKDEVDTVMGFFDIPPYVTIVPPWLKTKVYLLT